MHWWGNMSWPPGLLSITTVNAVDILLQFSHQGKSLSLHPTQPFHNSALLGNTSVSIASFNIPLIRYIIEKACRHKLGFLYNLDHKFQYINISPFITLQFERIRAYDADLGANRVVTYYLYGEMAGQLFTIDESTAEIQVTPEGTRLLDREIIPNFQVQVGSDFWIRYLIDVCWLCKSIWWPRIQISSLFTKLFDNIQSCTEVFF